MIAGPTLAEWETWLEQTVQLRLRLSVADFETAFDAGTLPLERVRDLGPIVAHIRKLRSERG